MEDGHEVKADLVIAMQTLDIQGFKKLLSYAKIDIYMIVDYNDANIFHDIANLDLTESIEDKFIEVVVGFCYKKYYEKARQVIGEMMGKKMKPEMLTPLMIAAKGYKLAMFKKYIQLGADYTIKNTIKQDIVHIAASNGYLQMLTYIKYELDMNMDEPDNKNNTPLHLAIREGKESIVTILIAWGCRLDLKDYKGNTVLHLSAQSKSYKITRLLLLQGIDRTILNNQNQTAYDISLSLNDKNLCKILKNPSFISKFNPFKPPLTSVQNNYKLFILYVLIFLLRYVCVIVFMLPHFALELSIISLIVFIVNFVLFLLVHQKNPGFVKQKQGQNIIKLYQTKYYDSICPFCEIQKDCTTFHCHHCEKCIRKYDHHCPWIRNCVGQGNISTFIAFINFCCLDFLYTSMLGVLDYFDMLQDERKFLKYKSYHKEFGLAVTGLCIIGFMFVFPVWFVQMSNIIKKTTTKERFGFKKDNKGNGMMISDSFFEK
ncbi:hypothetical protein SteCoe_15369 [Stentor coeruleus]|uniref:Palmitoyltransferase n=1 Tax=Stentor coeruleus TaxID=5963 RepID=A0A1R2C3P0_9CILI|nr:hypothetical protein SteCoe_15369 [Stentor coeruleus]